MTTPGASVYLYLSLVAVLTYLKSINVIKNIKKNRKIQRCKHVSFRIYLYVYLTHTRKLTFSNIMFIRYQKKPETIWELVHRQGVFTFLDFFGHNRSGKTVLDQTL